MVKPGYRTSEFWFTLVTFIFSGLYLVGIIGDITQKEDLIRDVSHGVESIILIGGQLAILWKYINSRKEIKKIYANNPDKIDTYKTQPKRKINAKPKSKKRASSKTNGSNKK